MLDGASVRGSLLVVAACVVQGGGRAPLGSLVCSRSVAPCCRLWPLLSAALRLQANPESKVEVNATLHWCSSCEVCLCCFCVFRGVAADVRVCAFKCSSAQHELLCSYHFFDLLPCDLPLTCYRRPSSPVQWRRRWPAAQRVCATKTTSERVLLLLLLQRAVLKGDRKSVV